MFLQTSFSKTNNRIPKQIIDNHIHEENLDTLKNKLQQPTSFGPGLWFAIHTTAKNAVSEDMKKNFILWIQNTVDSIKCANCRSHATEYVRTHPIEPYFNILDEETGLDVGIFIWTWIFHNAVNTRVGKSFLSKETAMSFFYDDEFSVCNENCGEDFSKSEKPAINREKEIRKYPIVFRVTGKQF